MRLVDETDATLAAVLLESLAVQLGGIAEACREGLMAVAVEAGLATALAIMNEEASARAGRGRCGSRRQEPRDRGKLGWKWSVAADRAGIPIGVATRGR